jgi:hypothetical protein
MRLSRRCFVFCAHVFVLSSACQLTIEDVSLEPNNAGLNEAKQRDPLRSELSATCPRGALCFAPRQTSREACTAALAALLESAQLSPPARCEVVAEASSEGRRAAVLRFRQADFEEPYWVALANPAGFDRLVPLLNVHAGVNTALALSVRGLHFADVVAGEAPELRMELHSVVDDHDCSGEWSWRTERTDLAACGVDDTGNAYCLAPLPRSLRRVETQYEPRTYRQSSEVVEQYSLDLAFSSDELTARTTSGQLSAEMRPLLGRHRLSELRAVVNALPFPN